MRLLRAFVAEASMANNQLEGIDVQNLQKETKVQARMSLTPKIEVKLNNLVCFY